MLGGLSAFLPLPTSPSVPNPKVSSGTSSATGGRCLPTYSTTVHTIPPIHTIPHTVSRIILHTFSTVHVTPRNSKHHIISRIVSFKFVRPSAHLTICHQFKSFQQHVLCDWRPLLPATDPAAGGVGGCSIVGPAYTLCVRPQRQNRYSCLRLVGQASSSQGSQSVKAVSQSVSQSVSQGCQSVKDVSQSVNQSC